MATSRPSPNKPHPSSLFITSFFLLLTIIITTLIYFLQSSYPSSALPNSPHPHANAHPAPPIPQSLNPAAPRSTRVLFSEHAAYENLSHIYDSLWEDLLPPNRGFWQTREQREDASGSGNVDVRTREYGIAMFHSLHCLGVMRRGVQELLREIEEGKGKGMEMGGEKGKEKGHEDGRSGGAGHQFGHVEHGDPLHWLHCFDYLRQTILCNADGTLEPPKVDSRGKENVDGMGERQCKDPGELWRLSVESFEG